VGGSHESLEAHEAAPEASSRSFGFVFAAVFALAGTYLAFTGGRWWWAAGAASALFALLAWLRPAVLDPLNAQWARLGRMLHRIVNPVVMAVIFYGAVLPTGLLLRAFGKDPLRLRRDPAATSYWLRRDPPAPDHFKNQF
jgi:hypothetical protein